MVPSPCCGCALAPLSHSNIERGAGLGFPTAPLRTASASRADAGPFLPRPLKPAPTPAPPAALAPGRGSRPLESGIPGFLFPPGLRPFHHRRDLPYQFGQVRVVEGLDVWVRRGPLHPDGGPASLDGQDHLQLLRLTRLFLSAVSTLTVLFAFLVVLQLLGNRSGRVVRRFPEETLSDAQGIKEGCLRSDFVRHGFSSPLLLSDCVPFCRPPGRYPSRDSLLISPRVCGCQYRSRSTAGTLPNTVASASSLRSK